MNHDTERNPGPPRQWQSRTVLVLEDDQFQRNILVRQLKNLGVGNIVEAGSVSDANAAMHALPGGVDVALCDLQMEGAGGLDFISQASFGGVGKFVLISALEMSDILQARRKALAFGTKVVGVLHKPVDPATLQATLATSFA